MNTAKLTVLCLLAASCSGRYRPQSGDIIFREGGNSTLSQSIQRVTPAVNGKSFTHVGLIQVENDSAYVLEATFGGVVKTPLHAFLHEGGQDIAAPGCYIGRLKRQYRYSVASAIAKACALIGKPYDHAFDLQNDSYYCSELIYAAFADSAQQPLFEVQPMTFRASPDGDILPSWRQYFEERKLPVPEGKLGLNPNSIAHSDKLETLRRCR